MLILFRLASRSLGTYLEKNEHLIWHIIVCVFNFVVISMSFIRISTFSQETKLQFLFVYEYFMPREALYSVALVFLRVLMNAIAACFCFNYGNVLQCHSTVHCIQWRLPWLLSVAASNGAAKAFWYWKSMCVPSFHCVIDGRESWMS